MNLVEIKLTEPLVIIMDEVIIKRMHKTIHLHCSVTQMWTRQNGQRKEKQ